MGEHATLPFDELHIAKLRSGLASARPANPEGVGDAYFSTDTSELNVTNDAGSAWVQHDLSAIGDLSGALLADGSVAMSGSQLDMGQGSLLVQELAGTPTTPASNHWRLYFKTGGLYVLDDAGAETGPLAAAGGGGGGTLDSGFRLVGPDSVTTISNASSGTLDYSTEQLDTDGYFDSGSSTTQITLPATAQPGVYMVTAMLQCHVAAASGPDGSVRLRVQLSTTIAENSHHMVLEDELVGIQTTCISPYLSSDAQFGVEVYNDCGTTVVIDQIDLFGVYLGTIS